MHFVPQQENPTLAYSNVGIKSDVLKLEQRKPTKNGILRGENATFFQAALRTCGCIKSGAGTRGRSNAMRHALRPCVRQQAHCAQRVTHPARHTPNKQCETDLKLLHCLVMANAHSFLQEGDVTRKRRLQWHIIKCDTTSTYVNMTHTATQFLLYVFRTPAKRPRLLRCAYSSESLCVPCLSFEFDGTKLTTAQNHICGARDQGPRPQDLRA